MPAFRLLQTGQVDNGGRNVDVQGHQVAVAGLFNPRVVNDERYTHRMIVHKPFSGQLAFAKEIAIVAHKNDHRIFIQSFLFQFIPDFGNFEIDVMNHPVIAFHTVLVFFRGIETPAPPEAVKPVAYGFGLLQKISFFSQFRGRHLYIAVKMVRFLCPEIL